MMMRGGAAALAVVLVGGCVNYEVRKAPSPRGSESSMSRVDTTFIEQFAATRRFNAGRPTSIKITPDGETVLFLRSGPRDAVQDLYAFDVASGEERLLASAERLLGGDEEHLSAEEKARRERMRLSARGIAGYQLSRDGEKVLVPLSGRLFVVKRATGVIRELKSEGGFPLDARFSPDGKQVACVRDGDVYVTDLATGVERRITREANEHVSLGLAEFVAQEEMKRREGYWWSPDSRKLVYQRTDTAGMEVMYIADAMHPEKAPQSWPYPRTGKANAEVTLWIQRLDSGERIEVAWDRKAYPYLATVTWQEHGPLTILVQNRTQTEQILYSVNDESGSLTAMLVERDDAWINLDQDMPKWLPGATHFFWTTERNGHVQLERRHRHRPEQSQPLTPDDLIVKSFVHVDAEGGRVFLLGSDCPTQTHLYQGRLVEGGATWERVTTAPGIHGAAFSRNHQVYALQMDLLDGSRRNVVMHTDGRMLGELRSVAERPPFTPNMELTRTEGEPSYHAVVIRPRSFEAGRRYPVIVYVYGGPHAQTVLASPYSYLLNQWIADHGFIVVALDGRGTPHRGRAWERVVKENLIDLPLADQVNGLRALGGMYPEMDLSRVGIYGWSFGGYFSAMAVMRHPEVYQVGVAGAPVCDWLDYDTHYTERYMGLPEENEEGYRRSNVLTYTGDLERPLLIMHGTADDNVYFVHALKMSNALFRAGRDHAFLPLSDFTHMVADPLVMARLYERILGFLGDGLRED